MARIDESKQDQMAEQNAPVLVESCDESLPVEFMTTSSQQVGDVGSVESFPLHDERFRPNDVFGWKCHDRNAEQLRRLGVLE